jgi:hypothetical protein
MGISLANRQAFDSQSKADYAGTDVEWDAKAELPAPAEGGNP